MMSGLTKIGCSRCGVEFIITTDFAHKKAEKGNYIYCPNGHPGKPQLLATVMKVTVKKIVAKKTATKKSPAKKSSRSRK